MRNVKSEIRLGKIQIMQMGRRERQVHALQLTSDENFMPQPYCAIRECTDNTDSPIYDHGTLQ